MSTYLNNGLQDVYDLGLTAQAFVVRPRSLDQRAGDGLDYASGTFTLIAHGLTSTDLLWFTLIANGGVGTLPSGASALTPYYPLPLDYKRFKLATSQGGSAVTFSDAGTFNNSVSSWGLQLDPERRLLRIAAAVSADIDQDLIAHVTPILPDPDTGLFPDKLVGVCARTTARRALAGLQFENPAFKSTAERLVAEEERDDKQRAAWRMGEPLYPTPTTQTNVPHDAMLARARSRVGRHIHWQRGTL